VKESPTETTDDGDGVFSTLSDAATGIL
jgi:hypothetical protein